jgi:hypothetical protein
MLSLKVRAIIIGSKEAIDVQLSSVTSDYNSY